MRGFIWWAVACTLILGVSPLARAAGDTATAQKNYRDYCATCHGEGGKGDGPKAATLATKPRDFTDCARIHTMSDEDLFAVIKEGGPARQLSKDMAAWGEALEDKEIADLVAYIRSFCKH